MIVGLAGVASGILVISANGWMNSPTGFRWEGGQAYDIDPWQALLNPAWFTQSTHMVLAAFEAVGFAVAGVHVYLYRRGLGDPMHARAIKIALTLGALAAIAPAHPRSLDCTRRSPSPTHQTSCDGSSL